MLVKAVILLVGLSTAYTLKCYNCEGKGCKTGAVDCGFMDRCAIAEVKGLVVKSCMSQVGCVSPISCCEGDLCNGAVPTGPTVVLLLLSSAIFSLFL